MKTVEASIAIDPERYGKKYSDDVCVHIGDSGTATDSVIFRKKLASFGSKTPVDRREMSFANRWDQATKDLKSRTVQTELEKISVDVSCQSEDLVISAHNETLASENFVIFSCTNACNEVVQEGAETKFMDSSYQTMNTEDAKGMKDISVADRSFIPYTFYEIEGMLESGNVRLENPTSLSASLQTKYSDELTEVISHRETDGIQLADHLSEIDVRIDGRSRAGQL